MGRRALGFAFRFLDFPPWLCSKFCYHTYLHTHNYCLQVKNIWNSWKKMAAKTRHKKWAVKIQHCPISSKFYMWVDNDVPNWFLILKNFYRSPFSKWPPIYCTNSTLSDFNAIWYVGRLWCPKLIPEIEKFLSVTIFKMATTIPQKLNIVRFQRYLLIYFLNLLSVAGLGDYIIVRL